MDTEAPPSSPGPHHRLESVVVRLAIADDAELHGSVEWVRTGATAVFDTADRLVALLRAEAAGRADTEVG